MLRLAHLGGGLHSRRYHLPALADLRDRCPGRVELAAFCDRDLALHDVGRRFGFARCYADLEEMLAAEQLDGVIAVTAIEANAAVAGILVEAGVPFLMEKPLAATVDGARTVAALVVERGARAMVSMNRRCDPALLLARRWLEGRELSWARCAFRRRHRPEDSLVWSSAVHAIDALRFLAGEVQDHDAEVWRVDGARWYRVDLAFAGGIRGLLEVHPTCGVDAETYDLAGPGWRLEVEAGTAAPSRVRLWDGGGGVREADPAANEPIWLRNGCAGETEAFVRALETGDPMPITPAEVLPAEELAHRWSAL